MQTYNDKSFWTDIITQEKVIERLNEGETLKSLQIDISEKYNITFKDKYSGGALATALKRYGYKKIEKIYYTPDEIEFNKLMAPEDIEEFIEDEAGKRYYDCFDGNFYYRDYINLDTVEIDKNILDEYDELSEAIGCDNKEEYITMVLLEHLERVKKRDLTREFAIRKMKENNNYSEAEIKFIVDKEKEGYSINNLRVLAEDYDLLSLTEKEFQDLAKPYKEV